MAEVDLSEIEALKEKASALKGRKKYKQAITKLNQAIKDLKELAKQEKDDANAAKEIRKELADTFGMKGGMYRRLGEPGKALAEYEKGLELEDRDSTYNLTNTITLGVSLGSSSPSDPEVRERLTHAIEALDKQTKGGRSDEWWAYSDLGQFHLLLGQENEARAAYERGHQTGPSRDEYRRHIEILDQLAEATKESEKEVCDGIRVTIADLQELRDASG